MAETLSRLDRAELAGAQAKLDELVDALRTSAKRLLDEAGEEMRRSFGEAVCAHLNACTNPEAREAERVRLSREAEQVAARLRNHAYWRLLVVLVPLRRAVGRFPVVRLPHHRAAPRRSRVVRRSRARSPTRSSDEPEPPLGRLPRRAAA
jgi:hypothetical protein